jgi:Cdc6-like AAA superfamily ATPase
MLIFSWLKLFIIKRFYKSKNKILNMQENIEKYCPNVLFNDNNISIGEFKTLEEAMTHPLKGYWYFNREEDNLFAKYKQQGYRILIICSWNRQDSQRFVIAIVGHHQVKYWDMNDVPIDKIRNDFEISIGEKAEECIYNILRQQNSTRQSQSQHPIQENNKQINTNKNIMKINESQLRKIIKESVKKVLKEEISNDYYEDLKQLLAKSFSNLNDNEKTFLYDLLNKQTWEVVYAALSVLKP